MTVPSAIRISENEGDRAAPALRFCASVWMCPDQFELRSALKTTAIVGRTSDTSAISIRPIKSGKNRKRATIWSAVSAGAPVRLSPRMRSSKLTAPAGNSDTEASPRSTGSSPVTARISACTALRTASAGIRNGKNTSAAITATVTAATANPRRFMLTAAVTTLSHPSPMKRAITDEIEVQTCKLLLRNLRLLCYAFVTGVGADTLDHLSRNHPVGEITVFGDLHRAQDR